MAQGAITPAQAAWVQANVRIEPTTRSRGAPHPTGSSGAFVVPVQPPPPADRYALGTSGELVLPRGSTQTSGAHVLARSSADLRVPTQTSGAHVLPPVPVPVPVPVPATASSPVPVPASVPVPATASPSVPVPVPAPPPEPVPAAASVPPPEPAPAAPDAAQGPPSGKRRTVSSARLQALATGKATAQPPATQRRRRRVAAGLAALGLLGAGAVALGTHLAARGDAAPADLAPEGPAADAPTPAEEQLAKLERAGRYGDGIAAALAALREEQDPEVRARLEAVLRRLDAVQSFRTQLDEALAEGPRSPALRRLIARVERGDEAARADAAFVAAWRARARKALGDDAYDELAARGVEEPAPATERAPRTEAAPPVVPPRPRPIAGAPSLRGDPRRAALLAQAARDGAARLEACRQELAAREAAAAERTRAEAGRALAVDRPLVVPPHRGQPGGQGRLAAYDERGFAVDLPGGRRRFSWAGAPPGLACDVLERAVDPRSADDLERLALAAARGGLLARAVKHLEAARRLAPRRAFPPLEVLAEHARALRGEGKVEAERLDVTYGFDDPSQVADFPLGGFGRHLVGGGALWIDCPGRGGRLYAHTWFTPRFDRGLAVEVTLAPASPRRAGELLVGVAGAVVALGPRGVGVGDWDGIGAAPRSKEGFDPAKPVSVLASREGDALRLRASQPAGFSVEQVVPGTEWPVYLFVGARDGMAGVDALRVRGHPDPAWFDAAQETVASAVELALDMLELVGPDLEQRPLPREMSPTSAEDPVALEGVPAAAREHVEAARAALREGDVDAARGQLQQAVARGAGRYWAAEYLLAQVEVRLSGAGALDDGPCLRLDQVIAALDGFAEAHAARSRLLLRQGDARGARADAEAAVAARPDYGPGRVALAWVLLQEGRFDEAVQEARLAVALDDDATLRLELRRLEATRDGPPWAEVTRRESAHYVLLTDLPGRADEVIAALEAVRAQAPRLLPCLRARQGAVGRKSRVLFFSRQEDFHRHAYRATGDRGEQVLGFFYPPSAELHFYDADPRDGPGTTLHIVRHEATHQWAHMLGLELPYWANEAVADYVGLWDAEQGRSRPEPQRVKYLVATGRDGMGSLFELMTKSPTEFYAGDQFLHYAQAWSFVHYCMEGGDARLRQALFDYLARYTEGQAGDARRQQGVALEHIYVETFHQLDRAQVERGWWAHVEELAREVEAGGGGARRR